MVLLVFTWVFGLLMIYLHNYQCFEYVFVSLYATLGLFVFIRLLFIDSEVGGTVNVLHLYIVIQEHGSTSCLPSAAMVDGRCMLSTGEGGMLCKVLAERQEWLH